MVRLVSTTFPTVQCNECVYHYTEQNNIKELPCDQHMHDIVANMEVLLVYIEYIVYLTSFTSPYWHAKHVTIFALDYPPTPTTTPASNHICRLAATHFLL